MNAADPLLPVGARLGGYRILALVGRGGMGEVYRARQLSMERDVALKVLSPRLGRDRAFAEQFVSEARAAGRLNHPHVVAVHEVGVAPAPPGCGVPEGEPLHYFSMEFIEGETLKERIEREGALDLATVARVMEGVVEALVFAEAHGIIHRDIKPDNIMLAANGLVKLADLGLAKRLGSESALDERQRGRVIGTPLYMAPEQARGAEVDHRADQYALGATLFHALTGRPPYGGESARAIMRAHCTEPVPDPAELNPQVPPGWSDLCRRLLAKDPDDRFPDARALRAALHALTRRAPRTASVRRSRWPLLAAGALGLMALAALAWLWRKDDAPPLPASPAPLSAPAAPDATAMALATAQRILERLPEEPQAALAMVERALADAQLQPAAALLEERRAVLRLRLEEQERERWRQRLAGIAADIAAQRYAAARAALAELPAEPWLEGPRQRLLADLERAQDEAAARWLDRVEVAADAAELERLAREAAESPLEEPWRARIAERVEQRRRSLEPPAPAPPAVPWPAIAARIEARRAQFPYAALVEAARAAAAELPAGGERDAVEQLARLGELAQEAETALRIWVTKSFPRVAVRIGGGEQAAVLHAIERDHIAFVPAGRTAVQRAPRAAVELPWPELLARCLDGPAAARQRAAFLWYWRHPGADAAIAALGDDPLAWVLARLAGGEGPPPARAGGAGTLIDYPFTQGVREEWLREWIGDGPSVGPEGLLWRVPPGISGRREADLPTLRWQGQLAPPAQCTLRLKPDADGDVVAVGFDDGRRRLRVALNARRQVFFLVTKDDDAASYEPLAPAQPMGYDPSAALSIRLAVDAQGLFTAQVDERPLVAPRPLAFAPGARVTPILQARPQRLPAGLTLLQATLQGAP